VLLSIEDFNALMEERENEADARAINEIRAASTPEDFEDWETVKAELRSLDGK